MNKPWLIFLFRVLPHTLLALILTASSAGLFQSPIGDPIKLPLALMVLMLFVAMVAFRQTSAWNLALYWGFALLAGALLGNLFQTSEGISWGSALVISLGALSAAAASGRILRVWLRAMAEPLWLLFWIYLAGWVAIALFRLPSISMALWAGAGLAIFFILSAAWFAQLSSKRQAPNASNLSHAVNLYLLGFNLMVALKVLVSNMSSGG